MRQFKMLSRGIDSSDSVNRTVSLHEQFQEPETEVANRIQPSLFI